MTIYLAHNYAARQWLRDIVVPRLIQLGHTITARWVMGTPEEHAAHERDRSLAALHDIEDLQMAELLLFFPNQVGDKPGRGKWVELGYALATDKPIGVIGTDHSCVFLHLPSILTFDELSKLVGVAPVELLLNK